ncbi:MAG TPA: preprotein translocase subunit SecE [Minicystis sp.]|nr:preprotein translocase subunit SecE [Minicystis sp.]
MAKQKDEPEVDEETEDAGSADDERDEAEAGDESPAEEAESDAAAPLARTEGAELAEPGADDGDVPAAAQLGTDRYVLAGFFAVGMLAAYVLGRTIQAVWQSFSNRDWFSQSLPRLAAVSDEDKGTYAFAIAGIVALVMVLRAYRRPDLRAWSDQVAGELAKVVWPTKKQVYSSTVIVIIASAAATVYLALLDRLWAFVTNIVYGDGS